MTTTATATARTARTMDAYLEWLPQLAKSLQFMVDDAPIGGVSTPQANAIAGYLREMAEDITAWADAENARVKAEIGRAVAICRAIAEDEARG